MQSHKEIYLENKQKYRLLGGARYVALYLVKNYGVYMINDDRKGDVWEPPSTIIRNNKPWESLANEHTFIRNIKLLGKQFYKHTDANTIIYFGVTNDVPPPDPNVDAKFINITDVELKLINCPFYVKHYINIIKIDPNMSRDMSLQHVQPQQLPLQQIQQQLPQRQMQHQFVGQIDENYISNKLLRNAHKCHNKLILVRDGLNKCSDCGICYIIKNIGSHKHQFAGLNKKFPWTTAWEYINVKTRDPDKYFLIVPNEHIETNNKYSYETLFEFCASDRIFQKNMLLYIEHIKNDALQFANMLGMGRITRVDDSLEPRTYSKNDGHGVGCLYIIVHLEKNSRPHMHFHCYVSGDNTHFATSIAATQGVSGPESDLFTQHNTIAMSLEKLIENIKKPDDILNAWQLQRI